MKNSQLGESARQLAAAAEREGSLQRELRDEQALPEPRLGLGVGVGVGVGVAVGRPAGPGPISRARRLTLALA